RTAASGWRSRTSKSSTTRSQSRRRSSSSKGFARRTAKYAFAMRADWRKALTAFDQALRAHGLSESTRRAYGFDLADFAAWAAEQDCAPDAVRYRLLRRYSAQLSEKCFAPPSIARKLAAIRTFYRYMVEREELEANPADLLSSPRRPRRLPRSLKREEVAELLDRIPAGGPLDLRDRAMFEL